MAKIKQLKGKNKLASKDLFKWAAVFVLSALCLSLDYLYPSIAWSIKAAVLLLCICGLLPLVASTEKGLAWLLFVKLAMVELSKVTWPSKDESLKTTFVVVLFVTFAAFLLWSMDAVLVALVRYLSV